MVSYECEHYPVLNQLATSGTMEKLAIVFFFYFPIAILISRATSDANGNSECYALAILGNNEIVEKLCLSFPSWYVKWQWHGTCRLKRSIIICDSFGR